MVVAVVSPGSPAHDEFALFMEAVLRNLATAYPLHRFYFFSTAAPADLPPNAHWIRKPDASARLSHWWWYRVQLPRMLKKQAVDVLLATESNSSLPNSCVHCLLWPHGFFAPNGPGFRNRLPATVHIRKAKQLAVFSAAVKASLGLEPGLAEKIQVVPAAVSAHFVPLDNAQMDAARDRYAGGTAYFLCAGLREPGALLPVLKAFSQFKKRQKSSMKLVVTTSGTDHAAMEQQLSGYRFRQDVVLHRALDTSDEAALYGAAYAVVAPAPGILATVVKALRCQVPVVTIDENRSFTHAAALYFQDQQGLAEQLMLVYKDENLRSRIIESGKDLAAMHTWENCIAALWQCIAAAVNK